MQLVVEFLVHDPQGGEEIAEEEEEEGEAAHEHLEEQAGSGRRPGRPSPRPLQAGARLTCHSLHSGSRARLNNVSALKSCQNWEGAGSYTWSLLETARWTGGSGTTYVSEEEEGQQEREAPPHPGLEAFCRGRAGRGPITQTLGQRQGQALPAPGLQGGAASPDSPTVRSMVCRSPRARRRYRQPLW